MNAKLYGVYLVIILVVRDCVADSDNLCNLNKLDNTCRCEYRTSEISHFPELNADCRWIELDYFPQTSQLPKDLRRLDLSHNKIVSLRTGFSNDDLAELILSYNQLDYIDYGFFTSLPNLRTLDLSHNQFAKLDSQMFNNLPKLGILDLSYNKLSELPENIFTPLTGLASLNLGYNNLGKFLEETSNIFDADIGLSDDLVSLNLDRLDLKTITSMFFGNTNNLKFLSMADNYFDDIPAIPASVTHFDFSGNNVSVLTVRHLNYHDLKVLHLNRMKNLQAIDKYALYNMPNLLELYIENCPRLRELNSLAFGVIRTNPDDIKLKRFSLARSGLQSINQTYLHLFKQLDYIDLQNNPFICDCSVLWMQLLNGSFHKSENMRCVQPINLRNKKIMDLTARNLPNCLVSPQAVHLQKVLIPVLAVVIMLLLVLIVYLVYMGPFIYKNYRGVGPESPYQDVTMLRQ